MSNTREEESNSALATLSLMRSIGTAVAPAIMVGFLMQAGMTMQPNLMAALPDLPDTPVLEEQVELNSVLDQLKKANPEYADMLDNASMNLSGGGMSLNEMNSGGALPEDIVKSLSTADVTNIVERTQGMATYMFGQTTPPVIANIQEGINQGIKGLEEGIAGVDTGISSIKSGMADLDKQIADMNTAITGIDAGIAGMPAQGGQLVALQGKKTSLETAVAQMTSAEDQMSVGIVKAQEQRVLLVRATTLMGTIRDKVPGLFEQSQKQYQTDIQTEAPAIEKVFQTTINDGFANLYVCVMVFNIIGFAILLFYKDPVRRN